MKTKQLTKDLYWVGNLDPQLRVFDIIMYTEFGTSYNSYVLKGSEKTALFETSKAKCYDEYLEKVKEITDVADIDYIITSHTEPDHSGSIEKLLELNPKIKIVGSTTALNFLKEICNRDFAGVPVKDGDTLSLGNKTLSFISAPNLHWPDTIYTYIEEEKALVTCDSFGSHYSCDGITNDKIENQENYMKALKYYYDMILGPFKPHMLKAIEKIEPLEIEMICPGHGPVIVKDPWAVVRQVRTWSRTENPNVRKTVIIPYVSAYGYTETLAGAIADGIRSSGEIDVKMYDMVTSDAEKVLNEIFYADGVLFGTPTILGEALKPIWDLTTSMIPHLHGGKWASAFGSYGWSGEGVPNIMTRLKQLRMKLYGDGFRVKFKPSEVQLRDAFDFGYGFGASMVEGKVVEKKKSAGPRYWKCLVCGEIVEGDEPPGACPVCGVGPEQFVEVFMDPVSFTSDRKETVLIIGNGIAGTAACEEIRKRNKVCSIEMISKENVIGYNRPMLTKGILSEIDMMNLFIKPYSWYEENNITLTLEREVVSIDEDARQVKLSDGTVKKYDKLILATGAESFVPDIAGKEKEGVYAIRSLADVNEVRDFLESGVRSGVVIGGGVLGLEAAWELKKAGLSVNVVETAPVVMRRQLDAKGGEILKASMDKAGIGLSVGKDVKEIAGNGKAEKVVLADGTELPAEIVIISTGVSQNVHLARAIGAETTRSIVVNEKMETGIKDVYACGDCAEYGGVNYAIWPQAMEMGKVAGANAAGDDVTYVPPLPGVSFNGMRTSIFSIGDIGREAEGKYKTREYCDEEGLIYSKEYFLNGRFCGGILMGDTSRQKDLMEAYEQKTPIGKMV